MPKSRIFARSPLGASGIWHHENVFGFRSVVYHLAGMCCQEPGCDLPPNAHRHRPTVDVPAKVACTIKRLPSRNPSPDKQFRRCRSVVEHPHNRRMLHQIAAARACWRRGLTGNLPEFFPRTMTPTKVAGKTSEGNLRSREAHASGSWARAKTSTIQMMLLRRSTW